MRYKKSMFGGLTLLFVVGGVLVILLNNIRVMPSIDEGALLLEYVLRPGVSLGESYRVAEQLIGEIRKIPDVDNIYLRIGSPEGTYYIEDVNKGELLVKMKPQKLRTQNIAAIITRLKEKFSSLDGVVLLYHQPTQEKIDESFSGLPAFFGVSVSGDNLDTLRSLAKRVEINMRQSGGLNNIINNAQFTVPQIEVTPKRAQLAYYGLNAGQLMRQLSLAFRGRVVARFVKEQSPVSVFLRLPKADRNNIEKLMNLPVRTQKGRYLPLNRLANVRIREVSPTITHLNGQREVTLIAEPEGKLWTVVSRLKQNLKSVMFPPGYSYRIRGQYQTLLKSIRSFALVIFAAVVFVYLLLYLQFNSFWQPFVILLKIPLDFIGVFTALLLTRQTLNISVGIGLLTLVGVSVNNAIILIDMVNRLRRKENMTVEQALLQAVHLRTRPILMTGLTTMLALLPAAIGFGIGSKIHQPFAITLIGGMVTGIFFSLNVIPALYAAFARRLSG
ncbi:MAG: efflux RND transporter permease subunit [Calditrichaeota bacterium]|nr:efflux RND transporter permease subunit [Calditrichota bacterium]